MHNGPNTKKTILTTTFKTDDNALARSVRQRVDAGDVSGATRLVIDKGRVISPDKNSAEQLRAKHPQSQVKLEQPAYMSLPIVLSIKQLMDSALSMSAASAPGPDGLRPSHLHQFLGEGAGDERATVECGLQAFGEVCTAGRVPNAIIPFFFGATLCALRKNDGSLRPIAIGNVLRRLISKAISASLRDRAATLLSPNQLGVGIHGGAEAAVHSARHLLSQCAEGQGLVKLDFRNAFNAISRSAVMKSVHDHLPEIEQHVYTSYGTRSYLFFGEYRLYSESGVQQADPLGPLLFSLALRPVSSSPVCGYAAWYLDDATLGGNTREVIDELLRVKNACLE